MALQSYRPIGPSALPVKRALHVDDPQPAIEFQTGGSRAINYGLNRVRFPAAVRVGSRIRGRFSLVNLKDLGDALEMILAVTVDCEGSDKPCCVAEWIVRHYR